MSDIGRQAGSRKSDTFKMKMISELFHFSIVELSPNEISKRTDANTNKFPLFLIGCKWNHDCLSN